MARARRSRDLAYEPFAQAEIARLEDLRVAALEQLIDAKLALGRHVEVVGQLEALIDEHPFRERLRGAADARALPRRPPGGRASGLPERPQDSSSRSSGSSRASACGSWSARCSRRTPRSSRRLLRGAGARAEEPPPARRRRGAGVELPTGVVTFLLTDIEGSSGAVGGRRRRDGRRARAPRRADRAHGARHTAGAF